MFSRSKKKSSNKDRSGESSRKSQAGLGSIPGNVDIPNQNLTRGLPPLAFEDGRLQHCGAGIGQSGQGGLGSTYTSLPTRAPLDLLTLSSKDTGSGRAYLTQPSTSTLLGTRSTLSNSLGPQAGRLPSLLGMQSQREAGGCYSAEYLSSSLDREIASKQLKYDSLSSSEKQAQDMWVDQQLRGRCPVGFSSVSTVKGTWVCMGRQHMMTDQRLAEGKPALVMSSREYVEPSPK